MIYKNALILGTLLGALALESCTWFRHDTEKMFYRKGVDNFRWSAKGIIYCKQYVEFIDESYPVKFVALPKGHEYLKRMDPVSFELVPIGGFYDQTGDVIYYESNHPSIIEHEAFHRLEHRTGISEACKDEIAAASLVRSRRLSDQNNHLSDMLRRENSRRLHPH